MDIEFEKDPQHVYTRTVNIIQDPMPSPHQKLITDAISLRVPYFGDYRIPGIELAEVVRLKQ